MLVAFYKNPSASRDFIKQGQGHLCPTSSLADSFLLLIQAKPQRRGTWSRVELARTIRLNYLVDSDPFSLMETHFLFTESASELAACLGA